MKKSLWGLGILFALVFGIGIWAKVRVHQQQAIVAVLNQANAATTQQRELKSGRILVVHPGEPFFSMGVYANRLNQISTVQCPEPFQLAWLNYVQTRQRFQRPFAGLGSVIEFELSIVKPDSSGAKDALVRLDRLDPQKAWMQVQVIALKYGVQIH